MDDQLDDGSQAYYEQVSMAERFFHEKEAKMSFIVSASNSGGGSDFAPPPAGSHVARCYRIIDLGTQTSVWKGSEKKQRKVLISWELPDALIPDGKLAGKPFSVSERFTASIGEKSKLRAVLESWRGRQFTKEEEARFDMKNIIGAPCVVNIVHANNNGKVYANIASIMPLLPGMKASPQVNESMIFSLDNFDSAAFASLSKGLQEAIQKSPEYARAVATKDRVELSDGGVEELNDDIPF